jgi:hypothetical protein
MTSADVTPGAGRQTPLLQKSFFWFAVALAVRLPSLWRHEYWNSDPLGFLYLGAALTHGHFLDLGPGLRVIPPGAPLLLGLVSWLPAALQTPSGFFIQSLLGAAWVVPVGCLIRRRHGPAAAAWGMALTALLHPLVWVSTIFLGEPLFLFALLGALGALESDRPRMRFWGMLLWPLAALTRAEGLFVALPALALAASGYRRSGDIPRRNAALLGAIFTALAVAVYALFFHHLTGDPLFAPYLTNVVGKSVVRNLPGHGDIGELLSLNRGGLGYFFARAGGRLPAVALENTVWWGLRALPAALALLLPALLWGAVARCRALWAARRGRVIPLDALDGIILSTLLIHLWVAPGHHHVPLLLLPMIPWTAAGLVAWQGRWPRLLLAAAVATLLWSGWHLVRIYAESYPEDHEMTYRIGRELGPAVISNDLAALDGGGRQEWLGRPELPFIRPDATADAWSGYARRFPGLLFAVQNTNLAENPPPPPDWLLLRCVEDSVGVGPICIYHKPRAMTGGAGPAAAVGGAR